MLLYFVCYNHTSIVIPGAVTITMQLKIFPGQNVLLIVVCTSTCMLYFMQELSEFKNNLLSIIDDNIFLFTKVIANYFSGNLSLDVVTDKILWPNGRDSPPPDTPACGFDGEFCIVGV